MQFEYFIIDRQNRKTRGLVEASSVNEAKLLLKEKGVLIVSIKNKQSLGLTFFLTKKKGHLNFTQLVDFTRQMGIMINAGLSLLDALHISHTQTKNEDEKLVLTKLEEYIKGGSSLSAALKNFPRTFPGYYISLIKAGESAGKLDDVFMRLAENLERSREFRGKISSALVYPIIVIIGIVVVAFIMMTFVLPKLLDLYKNFNVDLPITTQFVIALSNFSQRYWPFIIVSVILLVIMARMLLQSPSNQRILDTYILRLPVFGNIIKKSVLVEATRTLAILIKSGVPILEGINIVKDTANNMVYQEAFGQVYTDIEKGKPLGDAMGESDLFPAILVQMTSVGERTGTLDETLLRLSRYFQIETEIAVKAATTLIEPLVLIVLGAGVGFLVLSVLTPIYNLTSSFGVGQ